MKYWLCLFLLLVVGCAPIINSGRIISKSYYPAYTTKELRIAGWSHVGDVMIPVYVNETVEHPERWEFLIENEVNGKLVKRKVTVSKQDYETYNESDWIELGKNG